MEIKTFVFNPFQQNTYVLSKNNKAIIIDAGCHNEFEQNKVAEYIEDNNLEVEKVLITHYHFDHIMGCKFFKEKFPKALIYASEAFETLHDKVESMSSIFGVACEDQPAPDKTLKDNESIEFEGSKINILHIPGHSPCSLVYHFEEINSVFCGDVLFQQSIGRTDFPYGDYDQLISGIKNKLLILDESTVVYSGHGPSTTIGFEKQNNSFLA
jgi:glyoxylase-like metal-dependent hydrolase (beta-lactamase superfamily II)